MLRLAILVNFAVTLAVAFEANAITIAVAKIAKGAVQIRGSKAAPFALIRWEGEFVAQANATGRFPFATSVLPNDCVGTVSDGVTSISISVESCGPRGAQGPPGLPGSPATCNPEACATDPGN
ncbi:MAG: hypothetical protein AB1762_16655 [Gemmatimonadota bacterium]